MKNKLWIIAVLIASLSFSHHLFAADNNKKAADNVDTTSQDAEGENRALSAAGNLIGQPGPAVTLKTIDGDTIDLLQLYGKTPVYLKFWATWCVPCRQQMPGFEEIYKQYGDKIKIIAVNTGFNDDEKAVRRYLQQIKISMPIVVDDGTLTGLLNVQVTPMHILIGRDGRIVHVGHKDDQKLHDALTKAIATTSVTSVTTTATSSSEIHYKVGDTIGNLSLTTLAGKKVDVGAASSRQKALVFLAPWCEWYLKESRPVMASECEKNRKQIEALLPTSDIEWYGVSSNLWVNQQDVIDYQKTKFTALPIAFDQNGTLFRAFSIRQIPSVVLIDRNGKVSKILGPETEDIKAVLYSK